MNLKRTDIVHQNVTCARPAEKASEAASAAGLVSGGQVSRGRSPWLGSTDLYAAAGRWTLDRYRPWRPRRVRPEMMTSTWNSRTTGHAIRNGYGEVSAGVLINRLYPT